MTEVERILATVPGLPPERAVIAPLGGGITNRNYRIDVGGDCFVLRLGGHGTLQLGIDRAREAVAMRIVAELGVGAEVVHVDPVADVLVTRWVCGRPLSPEEACRPEVLARIARAARRYHEGPAFPGVFSPFQTVRDYHRRALELGVTLPAAAERGLELACRIEAAIGAADPFRPCHNDLLAGNLIDDGDTVRIIDWEYAAMGQACFDLGNFAVNVALDGVATRRLLEAYAGGASERELARLALMRRASDLREAFWGFLQLGVSKIDFDFRSYAAKHLDRVLDASPELEHQLREAT